MNKEKPIVISKETELYQPDRGIGYVIDREDWVFVKQKITSLSRSKKGRLQKIYNAIGGIFVGVGLTLLCNNIISDRPETSQPQLTSWIIMTGAFVIGILFFVLSYTVKQAEAIKAENILEFMCQIERKSVGEQEERDNRSP